MGSLNKQTPGNIPGYVYLLHRDNGQYKIGRSYCPEMRVKELKYQEGIQGELIWTLKCVDMVTTERAFHQRLVQYHVNREFFSLPDDIVDWVCQQTEASVCEGYDPQRYCRPDGKGYHASTA